MKELGTEIRRLVVEMSHRGHCGETGSALSISDILAVLYGKILNIDPKNPTDPARDRFVLSKGHGAAALYATLALRGFFPEELLLKHRLDDGSFHGHPSRDAASGVEVSTGSLGHGLSIATGMAFAIKATKSKVYVLIGDGECNEGSIWEAALSCAALKLPNIVAIIDDNKFQGFAESRTINPLDLGAQWESFGWNVLRTNGHETDALEKALREAADAKTPTVIIADTIAGKGIPAVEHTLQAHYYVPTHEDIAETT